MRYASAISNTPGDHARLRYWSRSSGSTSSTWLPRPPISSDRFGEKAWSATVQHRQGVLRLISELDQDVELLAELAEQNTRATARIRAGATEDLDYAALGYTIHNLYSLLENYALRIAKTFENEIDDSRWHRDLINRMTLEVATVRPAVWSRELARHVDELRRFRHAFRHVYDSSLDPDKTYARAETRSVGCFRGPGGARHTRREASRSRGGARVVDHAAAGPAVGRRFGLISVNGYCAFSTDFAP